MTRVLLLCLMLGLASVACGTAPPKADKGPAGGAAVDELFINPNANDAQKGVQALKLFRQAQATASGGDPVAAVDLYRKALKLYEELDDAPAQAAIHNDLGLMLKAAGQLDKARGLLERAVSLAQKGTEPLILAEAQLNLGLVHYEMGQDDAAMMRLSDALASASKAKAAELQGLAYNARGNIHRRAGAHDKAIEDYRQATAAWTSLGRQDFAAVSVMNVGYCQVMQGKTDAAAVTLQGALDLLDKRSKADSGPLAPHIQDLIHLIKTDPAAARQKVDKALAQ